MNHRRASRRTGRRRLFDRLAFRGPALHGRGNIERLEERCLLSAVGGSASPVWTSLNPQVTEPYGQSSDWVINLTPQAQAEVTDFASITHLLNSMGDLQLEAVRGLERPGRLQVRAASNDIPALEALLEANRAIESFSQDARVEAQLVPDDTFFAQQSGFLNTGQTGGISDADIDAESAWDLTTGSESVVVALIDSGIDYTHPDLYLNIWLNQGEIPPALRSQLADGDNDGAISFRDLNLAANSAFVTDHNLTGFIDAGDLLADPAWSNGLDEEGDGKVDDLIGWDFRDNDNDPRDEHGHGTHIGGVIGAVGNDGSGVAGLNWASSILPLRFLASEPGQGLTGSLSSALAAIDFTTKLVTDHDVNVRVSNNSWGGLETFNADVRSSIAEGGDAGVLFVAAAGNGEGRTGRGTDLDAANLGFFPASYDLDSILSVAATDSRDNLAIFSQFGATSIDVAAPGAGVFSTDLDGSFSVRNGTSMATPHVAGTAALVFSLLPDATVQETRQAVLQSVDVLGSLSGKVATGGRINARSALEIDTFAPRATLEPTGTVTMDGGTFFEFDVTYRDNVDIDFNSLDGSDVTVQLAGNSGAPLPVQISNLVLDSDLMTSGSQPTVTYRVTPPGGTWEQADNGIYEILLNDGAVTDTRSGTPNATQAQRLGEFAVDIAFVGQIPVDVFADGADSDTGDGISNNGSGQSTLRSAIQTANNDPGLNTLVLEAGTYVLDVGTSGEDLAAEGDLDVTDDLLIKGNGATIQITGSIDRVFDVLTGASLTLEDVMVTGGSVSGAGGGIRNAGTLVISASTLHDNTATTGGAIASTAGTVTATNSTISTNAATDAAGIDISGGTATLLHVTVTANDASTATGGVRQSAGGSVTLTSTIIAANTAPADPDSTGTFTSTFSLIGDAGSATGLSDGIDSNQVGSSGSEIDPLLGPLADNTGSTMTHRPLVGSSAIDAADNESAPATDQRGIDRAVNGNPSEDPLAQADIGAVERFFADISGITFRDTNGNGIQDNGEPGEPGFTVYLDLNNNEVLDPREPQTVSRMDDPATMSINEAGAYEFTLVSPGEYTLRELVPAEWSLTAPERNPEEALSVLPELKAAQGGDGTRGIVYTTKLATDDNELPVFPIGDFNGDALADFAVVNERTESVERSRYDISLVFGLGSASAELDLATLEPGNSPRGLFITQSQSPVTISNVAGADLNDDGFSDLVIGAKNDENNDQSPGRVFVVFGTDTHPLAPVDLGTLESGDGSTGFVIHGDPATDFILGANRQNGGFAVGDVNNDGIDDLAFASEFASPAGRSEAGRIRILFGSDGSFPAVINLASPAGVTLADIQGEVPGDRLGRNVEIGDVTGDGIDDIVAGAELFRDGVRHRNVFIVAGRNVWPTVLNASQITTESPAGFELESEDGSVHNIALSDFDGDGLVDVFLAANQDTVVYGSFLQSQLPQRTLDLNTLPGFNVSGIRTPEAGDFNADGFGDLIVFQSSGNRLNLQRTGLSHILFGSTDAFTQQNTTMGSAAYNTALDGFRNLVFAGDFNEQVRNPVLVGDTNGDGYEDFVTSTFQLTVDLVYLVYGKPIVTALPRSSHWALRLTPARAEHNLDFANQPLPSTLRGTVFRDGDQDGSRDVGEFGIEGFEVYLDANTNGMLDVGERSVLTDGVGGYVFADVAPFETHVVRQVNRAGFTQTAPDAGSGFEHSVTPQPGQVVDGLDFGNADNVGGVGLGGAVLEGRVFDDLNGNGVQDGGEPGLGGVTVYLDLNEDGDLDDTPILEPRIVTGASGDYAFIDLDNRNYIVRTVLPADLVQTSPLKSEFASQASASGQGPVAAVPIFFDGDAYPDLAVLTASRQDILIRVNNGDGMFAPGFSICDAACQALLAGPETLVAADLDGNGFDDLIVGNRSRNAPVILFNNGAGNFNAVIGPSVGSFDASSVAVGQFDNMDAFVDLAVASEGGNSVSVFRNDGAGNFSPLQTLSPGNAPVDVIGTDLNNDGLSDITVVNLDDNTLRTFLLQSNGQFLTADVGGLFQKTTGEGPFRLTSADLTGDGFQDVVVANVFEQRISVLENRGTGAFFDPVHVRVGDRPASVTATDLNADGAIDLAVTTVSDTGFSTLLNLGDGTFQTPESGGVANLTSRPLTPEILSGDFDRDQDNDLIILQPERDAGQMFVEQASLVAGSFRIPLAVDQTVTGLNFGFAPLAVVVQLTPMGDLSLTGTGNGDQVMLTLDGGDVMVTGTATSLLARDGSQISDTVVRVPVASITSGWVLFNGSTGNDSLDASGVGGSLVLIADGAAGNDTITGTSGDDTLTGGPGDDDLDAGAGSLDLLQDAGDADLTLTGTSLTGIGTDVLSGFDQAQLDGGDSANVISAAGFPGPVTLSGGGGDDMLSVSSQASQAFGQDGDDVLIGSSQIDTLSGGDGNDRVFAGGGADEIDGGAGNDMLFGQGGTGDALTGGPGDDTLDGGPGALDFVRDGGDVDLVLTNSSLTGVGNDVLISIEVADLFGGPGDNLIDASAFSGNGRVTLDGRAGADTIKGSMGNDLLTSTNNDIHNDRIEGNGGDDFIFGGGGRDTLFGGPGNDRVSGQGGSGDQVFGGEGNDTVKGGVGNDLLVSGDEGNDKAFGESGNDVVSGGPGNDSVFGQTGNDTLRGDAGDDLLLGAAGVDQIDGGADTDRLTDGADGDFTITSSMGQLEIQSTVATTETPVSIELVILSGGNSANLIDATNSPVPVVLNGLGGNDTLGGSAFDDTIAGGADDDIINSGPGNDLVSGEAGNDGLSGSTGDDTLSGGLGNDLLIGHSGADTLQGLDGEDTLVGGGGNSPEPDGTDDLDGGNDPDQLDGTPDEVNAQPEDTVAVFTSFPAWVDSI